uniref:Ig-like domain-containing protein n=1 Tax=Arion vulgaris TaxID=1028688 RepID=A0A0B6ZYH6_9EUPU
MASPTALILLFFNLLVLYVTLVQSKVAVSPQQSVCPHKCNCSSDSLSRLLCSISTNDEWILTCQQIRNYTRSQVIDLKVLGSLSSFSGELACLPKLRRLDLSETSLVVTENLFHGLRVDSTLNLSYNGIRNLPSNAFSELDHLYELDLSHNSISALEPEVFKGLNSLKILHLGFNNLSVLSVDSFLHTTSLRYLRLEYNRLQAFSSLYIPHSASLKNLNLQGNIIQSITTDINGTDLYLWGNLLSLDISGNPLECSCALKNLYTLLPNLNIVLVNSSATVCTTPEKWKGRGILNVNKTELSCIAPNNIISFPSSSKDVLGTSSITLQCHAEGYPNPSIMWITPWKDKFVSGSLMLQYGQGLQPQTDDRIYTYRDYKESSVFITSSIRITEENDLVITNFRGSMSGNYTCLAFNVAGNSSAEISLLIISAMKTVVIHSLFVGGYCASGFLIFGFIVGFVKMLVIWLKHKLYFIVPMFSKSPSTRQPDNDSTCHSFDVSISKPDSNDGNSDRSSPDSSLLLCAAELEMSDSSEKFDECGEAYSPGSWRSYAIFDSLEEAKGKLRYGVGRKMERMRKNVQSIKESGSVYVQNIVDSGSSAASRMKAGMAFGVEAVKYHVQSIKELCGTGDMGTQTISMISVETDVDSNQQKQIIKQITFV